MHLQRTKLYDDFEHACQAAVEVTDRYRDAPADDPRRDALWLEVVSRTELAQQLLKRWLVEDDADVPQRELALSAR